MRGENGRRMNNKDSDNDHAGFNLSGERVAWGVRGKMVAFMILLLHQMKR